MMRPAAAAVLAWLVTGCAAWPLRQDVAAWRLEPSESYNLNFITGLSVLNVYAVPAAGFGREGLASSLHGDFSGEPGSGIRAEVSGEGRDFGVRIADREPGMEYVVELAADICFAGNEPSEFVLFAGDRGLAKLFVNGVLVLTSDLNGRGELTSSSPFNLVPGRNRITMRAVVPESGEFRGRLLLRHRGNAPFVLREERETSP